MHKTTPPPLGLVWASWGHNGWCRSFWAGAGCRAATTSHESAWRRCHHSPGVWGHRCNLAWERGAQPPSLTWRVRVSPSPHMRVRGAFGADALASLASCATPHRSGGLPCLVAFCLSTEGAHVVDILWEEGGGVVLSIWKYNDAVYAVVGPRPP